MKEITGINHVGIRVTDPGTGESILFAARLRIHYRASWPEPVAIMEHPCGVNINLILNADSGIAGNILMDVPERHPGYTHMALDVTDIVAVEAAINALGIEITEGPVTLPDGGVMLFIRDQDRNVIEFHQNPSI